MKIVIAANKKALAESPDSNSTLLENAYQMFLDGFSATDIHIQCTKDITKEVNQLIKSKNIYSEPEEKGTAAAIGLASTRLMLDDPEEQIFIAYSDHPVSYKDKLINTINTAAKMQTNTKRLILIAVNPTYPETNYGYAKIGKVLESINGTLLFEMIDFKEKPDIKTAESFVLSWRYLWNTGYMLTTPKQLLEIYQAVLPTLYKGLMTIKDSLNTQHEQEIVHTIFKNLDKVSIDKGIYEKISNNKVGIIPVDLQIKNFKDF